MNRFRPGSQFLSKYGPWALIAGAVYGIGLEFSTQLAARGLNLVLLDLDKDGLQAVAKRLQAQYGVSIRTAAIDLASAELGHELPAIIGELEIGLLVYNACFAPPGPFLEQSLANKQRILAVNCQGPLLLADALAPAMVERRRGGIILMSSLAATVGTAQVAIYAATKAFNLVLAEGLWDELRAQGVDVLACRPGPTWTPGFERAQPREIPPFLMQPDQVAAAALASLGHASSMIPGLANNLTAFLLNHLLPRSLTVRIMGRASRKMFG